MGSVGFGDLPVELRYLILREVSSPKDLHSLIRASSSFYSTFLSRKSSVLCQVLRNSVHPEVLPLALACVHASEIAKLIKDQHNHSTRQNIIDFLRDHVNPGRPSLGDLRDLAVSIPLSRLWLTVDTFISDFGCRSLEAFTDHTSSSFPASDEPFKDLESLLSITERGRLQRAFFRFELYRRLFYTPRSHRRSLGLFDKLEQYRLFLSFLSPWEIEELACVHQYLVTRLEGVFDRLEDDFVGAVLKDAGATSPPSEPQSPRSRRWSFNHPRIKNVLEHLEYFGLNFFSEADKSLRHDQHIRFLLSRGLVFSKRLLMSSQDDCKTIVLSTDLQFPRAFLLEAMWQNHPHEPGILKREQDDAFRYRKRHFQSDSLTNCNEGWLWAAGYVACATYNLPCKFELRNRGYVFWDRDRLENSGMISTPFEPTGGRHDFPTQYRRRCDMITAEERLQGATVGSDVLNRLCPHFLDSEEEAELIGDTMS
ncbi:MAG: hypothetical protein M1837_002931 [Sclerophora amabilis]|nr:MAG: hypothetical protein M1837_002931 [Sclerophora amabilis]